MIIEYLQPYPVQYSLLALLSPVEANICERNAMTANSAALKFYSEVRQDVKYVRKEEWVVAP